MTATRVVVAAIVLAPLAWGVAACDLALDRHDLDPDGARSPDGAPASRVDLEDAADGSCPAGWIECGDERVDPASDPLHCDGCDRRCGFFEICAQGRCLCDVPRTTTCNEGCTDLDVDPDNCGACDVRCSDEEHCSGGSCVCRPELVRCAGACIDPWSNPSHCGGCDTTCSGAAAACAAGSCVLGCPAKLRRCGGACVDTDTHPRFCGLCGAGCRADEICLDSRCEDYLVAPGCTECPCDACRDYRCAEYPGTTTVICL